MFKMKQLGVVAVVMLCAVGAMANNFRAADQVYVPAAGHVAGGSGTFISDVWVANFSHDNVPVTVSVIFIATGPGQTPEYFNDLFTLQPGERKELIDFVSAARPNGLGKASGFGALVFNACRQGQDCVSTQDAEGVSPHYRDIAVGSRIYAIPPGTTLAQNPPTTGQYMAGIPWYHYASSRAPQGLTRLTIFGLRNTGGINQPGTYRGNVGLMNASQYSNTNITVKLFDGTTRQQIGSDFNVTLGPLGHTQQNLVAMFPAFSGATATNAYITIEQSGSTPTNDAPPTCLPDGCPGFLGYASVLDNLSSDATTEEAMYEKALSGEAITAIYGSAAGKPNFRRAVRKRQ
jgi:hypothetical protein